MDDILFKSHYSIIETKTHALKNTPYSQLVVEISRRLISRYPKIFPLGIFVAQYSVHAIAGVEPDYGIHFPNIRSPEGWLKDNARSYSVRLPPEGQLFRKGCQIGLIQTRGNNLNLRLLCGHRCYPMQLCQAPIIFFYYFNLNVHARFIFRTHLKNVFGPKLLFRDGFY
jgi:hypothetical protein